MRAVDALVFALTLTACCTGEVMTGVMQFPPNAGVVGQPMTSEQFAAFKFSLANTTGDPTLTLNCSNWEVSPLGGLQISYVVGNLTKESADAARIGVVLAPDKVNTELSKSIDTYYATTPNTTGPRLGSPTGLVAEPSTNISESNRQYLSTNLIKGSYELLLVVSLADLNTILLDPLGKANHQGCIATALSKVVDVNRQLISIDARGVKAATSTSTQTTGKFSINNITLAQEESVRAYLKDPTFLPALQVELRKCPSSTSGATAATYNDTQAQKVEQEPSTDPALYSPLTYKATGDVKNLNGIPRVTGNSTFGFSSMNSLQDPNTQNWLIGIGAVCAPCLLCFVFHVLPLVQCCFCCCGPVKKSERLMTSFNRYFLLAVFSFVLVLIGFAIGLYGENKFGQGIANLQDAMDQSVVTITTANNATTVLKAEVDKMKASLEPIRASCDAAQSMYNTFNTFAVPSAIPASMSTTMNNFSTMGKKYDKYRYYASVCFLGLGPAFAICYFLYVLKSQKNNRSCEFLCRCTMCFNVPLSFFFMMLLWLMAFIGCLLSLFFADFCMSDPVASLIGFSPGSMSSMEYFLTCKGKPPELLLTLNKVGKTVADTILYLDGIEKMVKKDGGSCQSMNFDLLRTALTAVADVVGKAIDLLRCKTLNSILGKVFYEGMCGNFTSGMAALWIGYTCMAVCVLLLACMYRKYRKTRAQVGVAGGWEEENLVKKSPEDFSWQDEDKRMSKFNRQKSQNMKKPLDSISPVAQPGLQKRGYTPQDAWETPGSMPGMGTGMGMPAPQPPWGAGPAPGSKGWGEFNY